MNKIVKLIDFCWDAYKNKVANGLSDPTNEKMMQLQFASILQTCASLLEFSSNESIKVLLEYSVTIEKGNKSVDIVIMHAQNNQIDYYPLELKCFRAGTSKGNAKRGAQNLGMYDYWDNIENLEQYSKLKDFICGFQLTITDDRYYVETLHKGSQVSVYSTFKKRKKVSGNLIHEIANRKGKIKLENSYNMSSWKKINKFYFIKQKIKYG